MANWLKTSHSTQTWMQMLMCGFQCMRQVRVVFGPWKNDQCTETRANLSITTIAWIWCIGCTKRDFWFGLPILFSPIDQPQEYFNNSFPNCGIYRYIYIYIYAWNFHIMHFLQFLCLGILMPLPITTTSSCNGHCYFPTASFVTTLWSYVPMMGLWLGVWQLRTQVFPLIVYPQRWPSPFKYADLPLPVVIAIL